MTRDCKQGQHARSCEICELEAENAKLRETLGNIEFLADRWSTSETTMHQIACIARAAIKETER